MAASKERSEQYRVFFSVNIFKIKQSMLLTFLRLLKIVQAIKSTKRGLRNLSTNLLES